MQSTSGFEEKNENSKQLEISQLILEEVWSVKNEIKSLKQEVFRLLGFQCQNRIACHDVLDGQEGCRLGMEPTGTVLLKNHSSVNKNFENESILLSSVQTEGVKQENHSVVDSPKVFGSLVRKPGSRHIEEFDAEISTTIYDVPVNRSSAVKNIELPSLDSFCPVESNPDCIDDFSNDMVIFCKDEVSEHADSIAIREPEHESEIVQASGQTLSIGPVHSQKPIHVGKKSFKCDECGKFFTEERSLKAHARIHTGIKPYSCSYCKKMFYWKQNLRTHMRTHTGEKPYECNICGRSFSQTGSLVHHIRTHTGERPFRCNVCGKTYPQKQQLKYHAAAHAHAKPFQCFCGKRFSYKQSLSKHSKVHSET